MEAHETTQAIEAVKKAIEAARQEGYAAGRADALKAIMNAASADLGVGTSQSGGKPESPANETQKVSRAPRGAVRQAVINMLTSIGDKGATTSEIVADVQNYSDGVEISGVSASNELQRQKGKLYTQNSDGYWHLIAKAPGYEEAPDANAGEQSSGALFSNPVQGREAGLGGGT